jgi:hypothetical protein
MQDNTIQFPTAEKPEAEAEVPNFKVLQVLAAARERFLPQITPGEIEKATDILKANPTVSAEEAGKILSESLNLDSRRQAWVKKEDTIEDMIREVTDIVKKYGIFPMASPRTVASFLFHQLQGLGIVTQDLFAAAEEAGEADESGE